MTKTEANDVSLFPGGDFVSVRQLFSSMVVTLQDTIDFASAITGVPLGRTDVLIVPNDAPSRELSHGHGPKGAHCDGGSECCVFS